MDAIKKIPTSLPGVFILEPRVFGDERGFFLESYNEKAFAELGIEEQLCAGQSFELAAERVCAGCTIRSNSRRGNWCGRWKGRFSMSRWTCAAVRRRLADGRRCAVGREQTHALDSAGFAHGFRVISEKAHVLYKATDYYAPEHERTLAWNDPDLKIDWELDGEPIVSAKDQRGVALRDAETFE